MVEGTSGLPEDIEQIRQRLQEFRSRSPARSRLPEELWVAAAELAKRYGLYRVIRELRLDYTRLKERVENGKGLKEKHTASTAPTFVELIGPTSGVMPHCSVEVESAQDGKLRLELKAVATTELANLIRAVIGQ